MTGLPLLAKTSFILNFVAFLFVVCCIALILIILVQKGKGGGLSSAFGGGMASGILGSKTGDFLTWVTIVLASITLMLAVLLVKFYKPIGYEDSKRSGVQNTQPQTQFPSQDNVSDESSGQVSDTEEVPLEIPDTEEPASTIDNPLPLVNGGDSNSAAN